MRSREDRACRWEIVLVAALSLAAMVRILWGSAVLPFFADTDEQGHYDLVHKFARGYWPDKGAESLDPESLHLQVMDGSPEFKTRPEDYVPGRFPSRYAVGRMPPPIRTWPDEPETREFVRQLRRAMMSARNHEANSPPAYYAIAACWYRCGSLLHFEGARSVYWVRFLNAPLYAALVVCAYAVCRPYLGRDVALATAAAAAFFPNSVFYTINSDVLSPLAAAVALLLLLRWTFADPPGKWLSAVSGAACAVAVLVKLTNAAVLVVAVAAVLVRLNRHRRFGQVMRESWLLPLCSAVPLLLWGFRNRSLFGDWTGTAEKVRQLGWSPKPAVEIFDHPIFTPRGLTTFLAALTGSFFDGDMNYYGAQGGSRISDEFFLVTAAVLPLVGLAAAFWPRKGVGRERPVVGLLSLTLLAYVALLAAVSVRFGYLNSTWPTADSPYLTSGRLMAGALVPFLALFCFGLDKLARGRTGLLFATMVVVLSMMVLTQARHMSLALHSEHNWFHLP